ncbi:hypothetical protein Tco_1209981 [Tanacetum coccineum]
MEESLSKFMSESAKIHEENSNLIKEIQASINAAIRNQGALIKTLEIQIRQMSKVLQERGLGSLPSSTETNLMDHVKSTSTSVEADVTPICRIGSSQYSISVQQNNRTVKYPKGIAENVLVWIEASLIRETLVLNRSLDPSYGDYIKLNDLNVPLELRRGQVDDLMPTIEEGEVIDEPMIDIIKTRNNESFDEYPSFCDFNRKIHIDCAYNLRFSCMIKKSKLKKGSSVSENIDGYRDQDMRDIILGEQLCKASCVEAKSCLVGLLLLVKVRRSTPYIILHPDRWLNSNMDVIEQTVIPVVRGCKLIMEYLVKISKKAHILELKRRHLKILALTSYTPYPSTKIRRICACTSRKTTKE